MISVLLSAALAGPGPFVGLFGGVHIAGPEHELYKTPDVVHGPLGPSLPLGVRAGIPVLGPLGLEGELFAGPATRVGVGFLYGWRAHANLHFPQIARRYTPMFTAGGGYLGLISQKLGSDMDLAVHGGPALRIALSDQFNLRTDLRWMLSARYGASPKPAGHGELLFSLSWNLKYDDDDDDDGIPDDEDQCPDQEEVYNDWKDTDGCPDQLASLVVTLRGVEGERIGSMEVRSGEDLLGRTNDSGYLTVEGLMPEHALHVVAAAPRHMLPGEADVVLHEGRNPLTVTLEWKPGAVELSATDLEGNPLAATVALDGPEPLTVELPASGEQIVVLEPGVYTARTSFGAHSPSEGTFELAPKSGSLAQYGAMLRPPGEDEQPQGGQVSVQEDRLVTLVPIRFRYDSHVVQDRSLPIIDDLAASLTANPHILKVEVAGHASAEGSDDYNLALSQRRMNEVVRLLVARGIDPARLVARGYGESKPTASNATEDGRRQNRRVEFNILEKDGAR